MSEFKSKYILMFVLAINILLPIVAIVGFDCVEDRIAFIEGKLKVDSPQIMDSPIIDNYPYVFYLKDTIVQIQLYKDIVALLFAVMLVVFVIFVLLKKKRKKID